MWVLEVAQESSLRGLLGLICYLIFCSNCYQQIGSLVMAANDDLLNIHFIAPHHRIMGGIHLLFTLFPLFSIRCHRSLAMTWQKVECIEITP